MAITVQDILNILEKIAPENLAESWDNVGLMVGNPADPVTSMLLGLDPVPELLAEAADRGANLIITHHPIIFRPLKSLQINQPDGSFIAKAVSDKVNVIASHTNLDSAARGVNDTLAGRLGLVDCTALVPHERLAANGECGLGRVGDLATALSPDEFIAGLRRACNPPWLLAAGTPPPQISRVAICGGSGSDLAVKAKLAGAQVYVTAEVKHSTARWAEQAGLWIIDAGHFATENPAMSVLAGTLRDALEPIDQNIDIWVSQQAQPLQLI